MNHASCPVPPKVLIVMRWAERSDGDACGYVLLPRAAPEDAEIVDARKLERLRAGSQLVAVYVAVFPRDPDVAAAAQAAGFVPGRTADGSLWWKAVVGVDARAAAE